MELSPSLTIHLPLDGPIDMNMRLIKTRGGVRILEGGSIEAGSID